VCKKSIAESLRCTPKPFQFVRSDRMPDLVDACLSLFSQLAWFQPADHTHSLRTSFFEIIPIWRDLRLHGHRDENCWVISAHDAVKLAGSNTDHRERVSVD